MALGPEANTETNQVECSGFSFSTHFVSSFFSLKKIGLLTFLKYEQIPSFIKG